jgi:cytidine deaminase
MINKEIILKHSCNEELVSAFIDNRMDGQEKSAYIKTIEECISSRKCGHCKQLIIEFLSIKKNLKHLQNGLVMPKQVEKKLLDRIRTSFQESKNK